jgi:L-lactate dehydrogenase complex protein LldF
VSFPNAASVALRDSQLRRNLSKATSTIRAKRDAVVDELRDWPALRSAGRAIKDASLTALDRHLLSLEAAVVAAGGVVQPRGPGGSESVGARLGRSTHGDQVAQALDRVDYQF